MHRPLCASLSILIESWAGEIDLNRHRGDGVVSAEELAVAMNGGASASTTSSRGAAVDAGEVKTARRKSKLN
tara:strand:+ start:420 stop:635 length:216 start_codon:yes stop_codon:yes gene_type:complete